MTLVMLNWLLQYSSKLPFNSIHSTYSDQDTKYKKPYTMDKPSIGMQIGIVWIQILGMNHPGQFVIVVWIQASREQPDHHPVPVLQNPSVSQEY